ncbi:MAG: alpha-D-ribose 1-methylphosphonate 5-triphosphate diphosphatase [Hyphomicrobiaceae bacterium]|nr:alpha-D-ribose 1-methylphosphonate 5-triphosphate diphosphatase [Hyphomicrobiaceae bacterium]
MSASYSVFNAKLVLSNSVEHGALRIEGEMISALDEGSDGPEFDFEGDYLVPGLVELHTDHLENHYNPRPTVYWNPLAALQAHDAQVAASGITTVFDAVRLGSDADTQFDMGEHVAVLMDAITEGRADDRLRAEHFVHLRCELASADALEHFDRYHAFKAVRLASLMDHTPGQRQFVTMDLYYAYYQGKTGRTDAEMQAFIAARLEDQKLYAERNRRGIVDLSHAAGLALASHDDATAEHVAEAERDGVRISEFPTTIAAAAAARQSGLSVLMGAPNVVRGGSHSGNVSAAELARHGLLDILSSDYVPFSMMHAAFAMPELIGGIDLPHAVGLVSRNPARAAGLDDRGEIVVGKRADFSRVAMRGGVPIVRGVWRQGQRVA